MTGVVHDRPEVRSAGTSPEHGRLGLGLWRCSAFSALRVVAEPMPEKDQAQNIGPRGGTLNIGSATTLIAESMEGRQSPDLERPCSSEVPADQTWGGS